MRKIEKINVRYGRGQDTYTIRALAEGLTKEEMIDLCDPHNWGGYVVPIGDGRYEVTVYTD
jgi:hypothetical protein